MAFQRHRFVFCFFLFTWSIILLYSEYMSMLKAKCLTVSETPFLTDGCMAKLCRLENTSQASAQRCERKTGLSLYLRSDSTFCHFFAHMAERNTMETVSMAIISIRTVHLLKSTAPSLKF